jgi:hypothetical protein
MPVINYKEFADKLSFAFDAILKQSTSFISISKGRVLNLHTTKPSMLKYVEDCLSEGLNVSVMPTSFTDGNEQAFVENLRAVLGEGSYILLYADGEGANEAYVVENFSRSWFFLKGVTEINQRSDCRLIGYFDFIDGKVIGEKNLHKLIQR